MKLKSIKPIGQGTLENQFQIRNEENLKWFQENMQYEDGFRGKYFKLLNKIQCKNLQCSPFYCFKGIFDGQGNELILNNLNKQCRIMIHETRQALIKNLNIKIEG